MDKELKIPRAQRNQSPGHRLLRTERRLKIIKFRRLGWSMQKISEFIGCSIQTVSNDLRYLLGELVKLSADQVAEHRQLELERLDALQAGIWSRAIAGNLFAIDRCIAICDRRSKLLGLDKPLQHILAGDKNNPLEIEHRHSVDDALMSRMKKLAGLKETPVTTKENEPIDITPPEALGGQY